MFSDVIRSPFKSNRSSATAVYVTCFGVSGAGLIHSSVLGSLGRSGKNFSCSLSLKSGSFISSFSSFSLLGLGKCTDACFSRCASSKLGPDSSRYSISSHSSSSLLVFGIASGDDGLTYLTDASLLNRTFLSADDTLSLRSAGFSAGLAAESLSLSATAPRGSFLSCSALFNSICRIFGSRVLISSSLACARSSPDILLSRSMFSRWICSFSETPSEERSAVFRRRTGFLLAATGNPVADPEIAATGAWGSVDVSCSTMSPSRSIF
ncbi:hypothetical protein OGATHE_004991 [Ogataea polymorpha]|uniref:Uncharacterized protein n=1 Tax=Ogataea polymorpha TaxID=460523 RepID=A0A9P8NX29_9ASCO|nr:hypothetical protein OGATHE_004991 [Ogataea polymorpha]